MKMEEGELEDCKHRGKKEQRMCKCQGNGIQ